MNYKGVIIEESLRDTSVLEQIKIVSTKIEPVKESHKTPWLKQWTLYTVEIDEDKIETVAEKIKGALETEHNWYADFKNEKYHFIVFRNKVFKVNRSKQEEYEKVKKYGMTLGIPDYQLDFSPDVLV